MKSPSRALAAVLLLAVSGAARAAEPVTPPDLFPADTLAYAELHDPAAVGRDLSTLFTGTPLADSIALVHSRRDKATHLNDLAGKRDLALLGLLTSPEMADEVKKLRVGAGLRGFTARGEPRWAVAVLTGDSPAAGLAARGLLTLSAVRKVGAVGGVAVYQFRPPAFTYDPNDGTQKLANDKPPTAGAHEPTFAYVPGLFVAGTDSAAVGDVVTRFQGTRPAPLAATPAFREATAAHRRAGVFYFANVAAVVEQRAAARKAGSAFAWDEALMGFDLIANANAVRYVAGAVGFRDGGVSTTAAVAFDADGKSPLLDVLSGAGAKVELLHHAPAPATVVFAVTLAEKNRAATVVAFLDAVSKANGRLGRLPNGAITELEEKHKMAISAALVGKTSGLTVVLPTRQELPKGAAALPVLVLHTDSADVAAGWEDFLPKLVSDLGGANPPQPSAETLGGVKVLSLPGGGLPWKAAVHYARKDKVFAVGLDRKLVAAAVAGDAAGSVVGGNSDLVRPDATDPSLVGTVAVGSFVRWLRETPKVDGPVVPVTPIGPVTPPRPGGDETVSPAKLKETEAKAWAGLTEALDGLSPPRVTARRVGRELRAEVWQPKVQGGGLSKVVTAGLQWLDLSSTASRDPNALPRLQFPDDGR